MTFLRRSFIAVIFIGLLLSFVNISGPYWNSYHRMIPNKKTNTTTDEKEMMNLGEVYHSYEVFMKDYAQMEKEFKIFVYPDGDENTYFHTPSPSPVSAKYASEVYFFKNIRESSFITKDPDRAHLFFVPISCHKMQAKLSSYDHTASMVEEYVSGLIRKYPYWNRTLGADHFFLACNELDVGATELVPNLVKNSIRVVCSSTYSSGFIPHKDISLPFVLQPFSKPAGKQHKRRSILGYWTGNCNTEIRSRLVRQYELDDELDINNATVAMENKIIRINKFYRSKFCLCPRGPTPTSSRMTMAIHYGCIPVILSNNFDLPFNDILDWSKFSVIVNENDAYRLKYILKAKSKAEFRNLHKNLVEVQKSFEWNSSPKKYDAFHMIMYELWLRRHVVRY